MKKGNKMLTTIILMGVIALILTIYSFVKGTYITGLNNALKTMLSILPVLILAFIIIGMLHSLDMANNVKAILGNQTGIKGISIATLGGMLTPGGPFVALPLAAILLKSGAGIGHVVAYTTAWSTWEIMRTPFEISFLGWKYVLVKWCCIFILPIISGLTAQLLFSWIKF